jgi:hypothetical protein
MDANEVIAIIKRRQAKFHAQRRSGSQEHMDEAARLIAEEYDALLAEIEVAAGKGGAERRAESLKVHGDPLDPPKAPAKKKGK